MTTRRYFSICVGLPIALCLLGLIADSELFTPAAIVGAVVYLPLALFAWWRIRVAVSLNTIWHVGAAFPFASGLLLGIVFAFPQMLGGSNGSVDMAAVGLICALMVGYFYVLIVSLGYCALRKVGLLSNEFAV
jgi:hypothetical protein